MEKKESYRHMLPHFQQPGQAYFVTWSLHDALPAKALKAYAQPLKILAERIKQGSTVPAELAKMKMEYAVLRQKYVKAFDDLLHLQTPALINLAQPDITEILFSALQHWEGKRLENAAFCIMPNHVHWVFRLFEKDENEQPVYLQDILQSVKRFSANEINELKGTKGKIWQRENWDTTIRDEKHLYRAIEYTINNPVEAKLVMQCTDWKGTYLSENFDIL